MNTRVRQSHYSPLNWTLACWSMTLLWAWPSIIGNLPGSLTAANRGHQKSSTNTTSTRTGVVTGHPYPCIESWQEPDGSNAYRIRTSAAILNIVIVIAVHVSIVWLIQTYFRRLTIRSFLVVLTAVSILVIIGQNLDMRKLDLLLGAVYLSPLFGSVVLAVCSLFTRKSRKIDPLRFDI